MTAVKDDAGEIARYLVREYGRAAALTEAARRGYEAQSNGQLYELSIWREVKRILRDLHDEAS